MRSVFNTVDLMFVDCLDFQEGFSILEKFRDFHGIWITYHSSWFRFQTAVSFTCSAISINTRNILSVLLL